MIKGLPRPAAKGELVSLDLEMYNQDVERLHRPHGTFACLSISYGRETYQVYDIPDLRRSLKLIDKGEWALHNSLYDLRQLRALIGNIPQRVVWDSMLVDQGLYGGWFGHFALEDLHRRYLAKPLPKSIVSEFGERTSMTLPMQRYAAKDAEVTLQIAKLQKAGIEEDGISMRHYFEIDEPMIWSILDMPKVCIDVDGWLKLAKFHQHEGERLQIKLGFNVYSSEVTKLAVEKMIGFEIKDTNAKETLEPLTRTLKRSGRLTEAKFVELILKARQFRKAAETYGQSWVDQHVEPGGFVYPDWKNNGTETARMSCLTGDTILNTSNGIFRLLDLDLTGNRSHNIITHRNRLRQILAKIDQGIQSVYSVRLSNGESFKATQDHKIYTPNGWREIRSLKVGDAVLSSIPGDVSGTQFIQDREDVAVFKTLSTGSHETNQERFSKRGLRDTSGALSQSYRGIQEKRTRSKICRSGDLGRSYRSGTNGMGNSEQTRYSAADHKEEYPILQNAQSVSARHEKNKHGAVGSHRENISFSTPNTQCWARVRKESRKFLYGTLQGFPGVGGGFLDFAAYYGKRDRSPKTRSYMLETQSKRDAVIKTITGSRNTPLPRIFVGPWEELHGRLCISRKEIASMARWEYTRIRSSSETRQRTVKDVERGEVEVESLSIGCRYGGDSKFHLTGVEEITYLGQERVWDLMVEEDHSFLAHGVFHHNCSNPNLQNIPTRDLPVFRSLFISRHGKTGRLLIADQEQQEVRILAHLSGDQQMRADILANKDLHAQAALDFGLENRDEGKETNFALSYGQSAWGLARRAGISEEQARIGIKKRNRRYPAVVEWSQKQIASARALDYVKSTMGRRVWVNRYALYGGVDRNAINSPVQTTASEQTKLWQNLIHAWCTQEGYDYLVGLAVHDELVVDLPPEMLIPWRKAVKESGIESGRVTVPGFPMKVKVSTGVSWGAK